MGMLRWLQVRTPILRRTPKITSLRPHFRRPMFEPLEDRLAPVATTTTILNVPPSQSTFGDQVAFTAQVDSPPNGSFPSGQVAFFDGQQFLGTADITNNSDVAPTATFVTGPVQLLGGQHFIFAAYQGDASHDPSQSQ